MKLLNNKRGSIPVLIMMAIVSTIIIIGCAGLSVNDDATTQVLVSIAVRNIACEISGDEDLDSLIRDLYESVKLGTISEGLMSRIADLTTDRPTLAADILDLSKLLGLQINDEDGTVLGLESISPEMFATIERAYMQGINMCK